MASPAVGLTLQPLFRGPSPLPLYPHKDTELCRKYIDGHKHDEALVLKVSRHHADLCRADPSLPPDAVLLKPKSTVWLVRGGGCAGGGGASAAPASSQGSPPAGTGAGSQSSLPLSIGSLGCLQGSPPVGSTLLGMGSQGSQGPSSGRGHGKQPAELPAPPPSAARACRPAGGAELLRPGDAFYLVCHQNALHWGFRLQRAEEDRLARGRGSAR